MELSKGFLLFSMVLSVLSVPVLKTSHTILDLMAQDKQVCNFPPREMLQETPGNILKLCRLDLEDNVNTEQQIKAAVQDNENYLLCMNVYDTSKHICKSDVPLSALPNSSEQFNNLFQDETKAEDFCSDVKQLDPLHPADNLTTPWVNVLNEVLADEEQCTSLCMVRLGESKVRVKSLCKVIAWGRKIIAESVKGNPSAEATIPQLEEESLTQNGNVKLDPEDSPFVEEEGQSANIVKPVSSSSSQPASSLSITAPKSVPSSPSASAPVIKTDKPLAQTSNKISTPKKISEASSPVSKAVVPEASSPSSKKAAEPTKSSSASTASAPVSDVETPMNGDFDDHFSKKSYGEGDDEEEGGVEGEIPPNFLEDGQPTKSISSPDSKTKVYGNFSKEDPVENESNFYAYFLTMAIVSIVGYVLFHNKQKILALLLEGRKNSSSSRRRPNSSNYRKLDTNLEEAITSPAPRSTNSHVIY